MFLRSCINFIVLFPLLIPSATAQRIFATVDPTPVDESLRFDVNNIPVDQNTREYFSIGSSSTSRADLNYSPNIVFSDDSTKAFVSYSGSDTILVFDPYSGDILDFIEIDANPTQIAKSPDGSKLVVTALHLKDNLPSPQKPAAYTATIAVIEIETLAVRSVQLENLLLSFANNAVFSPDSQYIVVSSMGTSELIRLNVDTLEEAGSRIQLTPGSRPAVMTVSPDKKVGAVVLIGSPSLSRVDHPDSIALLDLASFQVMELIAPKTGIGSAPDDDSDDFLLHDFGATNKFTFSSDGKFGIISDVGFSSISIAPELSFDRAWIYDFERKEFFPPIDYPGIATVSFWSPLTREFVALGTFNLTFLDPYAIREALDNDEDIPRRSITPTRSNFRPKSKAVFDQNEKLMYLAAPLRDSLLIINLETDEIRGIEVGERVKRKILSEDSEGETQESEVTYPAGPLDVALTPDNEVIAVLNFNANTVDLIKETDKNFLPGTHLDPEFFVGIAISNPGELPVDSILTGYSLNGLKLDDNPDTEEIVEYVNPAELDLPAKGQSAQTVEEILQVKRISGGDQPQGGEGEDEENETPADNEMISGWLYMEAFRDDPKALFLYGDYSLNRLDGGVGKSKTYQKAIFPYLRTSPEWKTELYILNPNISSTRVFIALYDSNGILVELESRSLPARFLVKAFVKDPNPDDGISGGIFDDSVFEPCEGGTGTEDEEENYDEEDNDPARHCGFDEGYIMVLVPAKDTTDENLQLPDGGFVAWERFYTDDKLAVNDGIPVPWDTEFISEAQSYYLPFVLNGAKSKTYVNLANPSAETVELTLTLHQDDHQSISAKIQLKSAQSIRKPLVEFFNGLSEDSPVSGWLSVDSNRHGLAGNVELEFPKSITSLPLISKLSNHLIFSHQASTAGISTGIALVNPAAASANITLQLYSPEGELLDTAQVTLDPESRISRILHEIFDPSKLGMGGFIEVESDQPVAGIETLFRNNLEALAAIVAQ